MNGFQHRFRHNQGGFTLIEIIAVLIIVSTLAAIAVPKFIGLDDNAKDHAIDSGISELNGRESLVWANIKVSSVGWLSDAQVFGAVSYNLGFDYDWTLGPNAGGGGGGTLRFQLTKAVELERSESGYSSPAKWSRK